MKKRMVLRVAMGVLSVAAWLAVGSEAKAARTLCEGTWELRTSTQTTTVAGQTVPSGGHLACKIGEEQYTCSIRWSLEPPYGVQQNCFDSPTTVTNRLITCATVYEAHDPYSTPPTYLEWVCRDTEDRYLCSVFVSPPATVLTDCI